MYLSSDGNLKNTKDMDTSYLINALNKTYKEIWNSLTKEQYDIYNRNLEVLTKEIKERISEFSKKFEEGELLND